MHLGEEPDPVHREEAAGDGQRPQAQGARVDALLEEVAREEQDVVRKAGEDRDAAVVSGPGERLVEKPPGVADEGVVGDAPHERHADPGHRHGHAVVHVRERQDERERLERVDDRLDQPAVVRLEELDLLVRLVEIKRGAGCAGRVADRPERDGVGEELLEALDHDLPPQQRQAVEARLRTVHGR
jgi:hypothetical protein